jgi:hypothetical protein
MCCNSPFLNWCTVIIREGGGAKIIFKKVQMKICTNLVETYITCIENTAVYLAKKKNYSFWYNLQADKHIQILLQRITTLFIIQ